MTLLSDVRWTPAQDWTAVDARLHLPPHDGLINLGIRRNAARPNGVRQWSDDDPRLIGLLGERAAARYLNVPMHLDVNPHGDQRTNLITHHGVPVDVMTRKPWGYPPKLPDLAIPTKSQERTRLDLALLLVVWLGPQYEPIFRGWVWEAELRAHGHPSAFGDNPNIVAPVKMLRDPATLLVATPLAPPPAQLDLFGNSPT